MKYYSRNWRSIIAKQFFRLQKFGKQIPQYIALRLRQRLRLVIAKRYKRGSAVRDLGCSVSEFKQYRESKFQPGMNWDNRGRQGWRIDYIGPLALFDLAGCNQLGAACHYTSLQSLWAKDNIRKGGARS